jgi:hypothetical protein
VLTANVAFQDWPSAFPNASCATAVIDRVIHHADVLAIEGDSYRLRRPRTAKTRTPTTPRSHERRRSNSRGLRLPATPRPSLSSMPGASSYRVGRSNASVTRFADPWRNP